MENFVTQHLPLLLCILAFVVGCLLTFIVIPEISLIAKKKRLFDAPSDRKVHKSNVIPRLAGFSFLPNIMFALAFTLAVKYLFEFGDAPSAISRVMPEVLLLICSLILLYLIGIADDLIGIRYRQKFRIQIICGLMILMSGLWINDLYGLLGLHSIPWWLGMPLTLFFIILAINAINLIDGIDGLASGLSSIALAVYGTVFFIDGQLLYALLSFATLGVLLGFFYYNVFGKENRGRKIFMGDTGSLTTGMILAFLALKIGVHDPTIFTGIRNPEIIAVSLLIVPVFDVAHVMLHRLKEGRNPFSPDKSHIHHKFLAMGFTPKKAMVAILMISVAFAAANIILARYININILAAIDIAAWMGMIMAINASIKRKTAGAVASKKVKAQPKPS